MAPIFILAPISLRDPYADTPRMDFSGHAKAGEGGDGPCFQVADKAANVRAALFEIHDYVHHSLPRPVVRVLAAPPGLEYGKAVGGQQV